jgi:hypothetical protein
MGIRRRYRRSDLFLVRIWTEVRSDGSGHLEKHGRVQRVVDGETHHFDDWPTLIELLVAMTADYFEPVVGAPAQDKGGDIGGQDDEQA